MCYLVVEDGGGSKKHLQITFTLCVKFPDSIRYAKWSKDLKSTMNRRGYLCTQWRQLECFLHDISFLHDSLNEKFPSGVRCASSFKVPWKSFLLWPRCPSELPVPKTNCCHCSLMRRKREGCSYCTFSLLNISDSLSPPCKKKIPLFKRLERLSPGGGGG